MSLKEGFMHISLILICNFSFSKFSLRHGLSKVSSLKSAGQKTTYLEASFTSDKIRTYVGNAIIFPNNFSRNYVIELEMTFEIQINVTSFMESVKLYFYTEFLI